MAQTVKVIEITSGEVLFSCTMEQRDKAYDYAEQMEAMGIDVRIDSPSCPETLATALSASKESIDSLKKAIDDEIKSHDITEGLGCAVCLPDTDLEQ